MSGTRTYQAYTMAEALAAVKYDLGPEAIILSTRTFKRGGLLGLGRRTIVEVIASNSRERPSPKPTGAPASQTTTTKAPAPKPAATPGSDPERDRQRRLAQALEEKQRRLAEVKPIDGSKAIPQSEFVTPAPAPVPPVAAPLAAATGGASALVVTLPPSAPPNQPPRTAGNGHSLLVTVPATPMSVAAKRFILRSADGPARPPSDISSLAAVDEPLIAVPPARPSPTPAASNPAGIVSIGAPAPVSPAYSAPARPGLSGRTHFANIEIDPQVQNELAAIKSMVGQVLQRQTVASRQHTLAMPPRLFDVYLRLVGLDVPDDLADAIVNELRSSLTSDGLDDEAILHAAAIEQLAEHIPVSPTPLTQDATDGRPFTIALVGPTGVGKTTTLAKLAASFKLKAGRKVGLITSDTYRIAAVEQLRTYANIIGLPLHVALTAADMRQAITNMSDCEVVLVDTAGRSQNDAMRIAELRLFIEAAAPHEVHMVLAATAGEKVLASEAESFGRVGVDKLILTKVDEAASLGGLMNLLRQVDRPISFITTGQEVPDHLEPATARRLAELVFGGPVHE